MKKFTLILLSLCFSIILHAQVLKTATVTAGSLSTTLTATELSEVTNLTLTGTIDARDFKILRDNMPLLAELDLSQVSISAYTGTAGTAGTNNFVYQANGIPDNSFVNDNPWVGKTSLTSIKLPAVTSIGNFAFFSCSGLTSINIPSSVTSIGFSAFVGISGLITVNVSNPNYSSIDGILFNKSQTALIQCPTSKTGNYSIPSTITSIGNDAFRNCSGLASLTIPSSVVSIGDAAFIFCSGLTAITIPTSVTSIGSNAFQFCSGLSSVNIPSSVTSIKSSTFAFCTGLKTVTIPSTVTSVGTWTFYNSSSLSKIYALKTTPVDLNSSSDVFYNVNKTTCILYVTFGTKGLYEVANQWKDFTNIIEMPEFKLSANTATIAATGGTATSILTTGLVWSASSDQTWLNVNPTSGTGNATISFTAESNSTLLTRKASVTVSTTDLPSQTIVITQAGSPKTVAVTAGGLASALTTEELAIVTKLTLTGTIDARDFKTMRDNMPLLAELDLSGVSIAAYIGTEGTWDSNNRVYPANGVPTNAFTPLYVKTSLTSIILPTSINSIGQSAFERCIGLTGTLIIPSSVTSIGSYAIYGCSGLTSVIIPSSVSSIGGYPFCYCKCSITVDPENPNYSSIDGVLYDKNITKIIYCPNSKTGTFTIPTTVNTIDNAAFSSCSKLTSIIMSLSITSIGGWAFDLCSGLSSITISEGVKTIGYSVFHGCSALTSITIPKGIREIQGYAFSSCSGLTSINANLSTPLNLSSSQGVFENVNKTICTLNVPYGSKSAYQAANQWKDFTNIIEATNEFNLSAATVNIGTVAGSTTTVGITANVAWTASSNQTWLAVSPSSGDGNNTLTFTAEANPSKVLSRVAIVTVSATGADSQTITVIQESLNLIKNGNFVTDGGLPSPWTFWSANGGLAPIVTNGVAACSPVASPNIWDYGFGQTSLTALPNIPYTFSFKAWSASNRSISVTFQDTPENNYNRYGTSTDPEAINGNSEWTINLTTVPTTYTFHVVFDKMVPTTVQYIQFMLNATSDIVYIDDVSLISAEDLKPSTNLVITECYMGDTPQNYFEITNMGSETINLSEFEFGHLGAWDFPWSPLSNPLKHMMLPQKMLAPGKSFVISSAFDYNPKVWTRDSKIFRERLTKPEFYKIADLMLHVSESVPLAQNDSVTPTWNVVEGWGGRETYFLRHHYINPVTGLEESTVIDQVGGVFDEADGTNYSQAYSVAGIPGATYSHVLIRKNSVKNGNLNFNSGRGTDFSNSEWIPVEILGWNNYGSQPWRAVFWTAGNQLDAKLDASTLVSKTGKVLVDFIQGKITVPWGVRNDDSIMYQFVRKPGLAWKYDYAPTTEDSAYISARNGDRLTIYTCGNEVATKEFAIVVQEPTNDDNIVIPKNAFDYTKSYYGRMIHPYSDYRVTDGIPVIDTIKNVVFATRVDTLFKYLEKPTIATWKIIYADGIEKPEIKNGDKLRVTSKSGQSKDYFIKVDKFFPSPNALLSSITWPDMPAWFKGADSHTGGWKGDTIPEFVPSNKLYIVKIPLGYDGIPALSFTKQQLDSKVIVTRAKTLTGSVADRTITFTCTAENDTDVSVYTVRFEKEKDPAIIQPLKAEPFISQVVFQSEWSSSFLELANPGTEPIDLSNYMIMAAYGTEGNTWNLYNGTNEWQDAYMKYVPGKKWQDAANWQVQPRVLETDLATNAMVAPGDVFVMAQVINNWVQTVNHPYIHEVDVNFADGFNPWGINITNRNIPSVWLNNGIYLYKILNDSVKNGLKPATDRNDFELIESFGGVNTNNWVIGGVTADQRRSWVRKPNIYKGNPIAGASFGTNKDNSEWIETRPEDYNSFNLGWPWTDIAICTGIGSQTLDEITIYKSTVSSKVYKVSPGYSNKETIKGLTTGTTVSAFYNNIIKADALQTLKVKSASTGLVIPDANAISKGDTLIVVSADEVNTSTYILDVTANGLSSNALLTSTKYTVNVTGTTGTIGGFSAISPNTLLKDVFTGVIVPAGATLTITDANDAYVSLTKLSYNTAYVNVIATDKIYFEVIAENGITRILYQLKPTSTPSDAYLTSDIYSVDQFASLIQFIPDGTSVHSLLSNTTPAPGATMVILDKSGFVRNLGDIYRDDKLIVTSADGNSTKTYYLSMLNSNVNTYLAYVNSDDYQINQVTRTILGPTTNTTLNDFKSKLYPSFGATLKVLDKNGNESNLLILDRGDRLLVTAADGLTTAFYNIDIPAIITHFVPIWTGNGTDHMNINIYSAKIDGVELEAGDEVGIFDGDICVGVGTLTGSITSLNTLDIAVSKNDGSGNGYTPGNAITYKLYDKSKAVEISTVGAIYSDLDPSWSTDGKFAISATAFAELSGLTKVNQDITLNTGWNIISANVIPSNLNLKDLFQTLIDAGKLKKVMDESGKTIENFGAFGGWKNNIGNLNSAKGYKVNVLSTSTLSLEGTPVTLPFDLALATGWNIISYPSGTAQDAKALFQLLIDGGKLKKVMDEAGKTIENFGAFGGWKNNIGNLLPGKGYKVNVLENCTLTILANGTKAATIVPEVLASTHFTKAFSGNGTDHASINLVNLQASGLQEGDEIGIYDGKLCVGSATIGSEQLMDGSISIPASANDGIGESPNGFVVGNRVSVKLYRNGQTYPLTLTKLEGQDIFDQNASLFAQVAIAYATGINDFGNEISFRCYPNPFKEQITIEIQSANSEMLDVNIYTMDGKLVRKLYSGKAQNQGTIVWNGCNNNSVRVLQGTYLINANGKIEKVVLKD